MRTRLSSPLTAISLVALFVSILPICTDHCGAALTDSAVPSAARARMTAALDTAPLAFIQNRGQVDSRVVYYLQGRDKALYFTPEGVTLVLRGAPGDGRSAEAWVMKLDFSGAAKVQPEGLDPADVTFNYFSGKPSAWMTGVAAFRKLVYRDLWPGIDLEYSGDVNRLKYQFVVRPGADPSRIALAWRGALDVRTLADGRIEVSAPGASFTDAVPVAWQERDGARRPVQMTYVVSPVDGSRTDAGRAFSFQVGDYDRDLPLVLDPAVYVYSGYLGGSDSDYIEAIAVDSDGAAYVTGPTASTQATFPVAVGPDLTHNGSTDVFVAKVKADGTGLDWCGYIGGSGNEEAHGIDVDTDGNAYVIGFTSSDEGSFPVTVGPDLVYNGGTYDVFVAKVKANGSSLDWCGYIGGTGYDQGHAITVDSSGNAYVAGYTGSSEASFPVAVGPDLSFNGSNYDVFVARVRASGAGLDWCGYIGGNGNEFAYGIARTTTGALYVVGHTGSWENTFPVLVGPDLTHDSGSDAFIARVKDDGSALETCGYIGGSGNDYIYGVALDNQDRALVAGETSSTEASFPVAVGPDTTSNGGRDAFVARMKADGTALEYCGYIGGANDDTANAIAVDSRGRAVVVGSTLSDEASFPVLRGPDSTFGGVTDDGFAVVVRPDGGSLLWGSYIGGSARDLCLAVAVDGADNVYAAGYVSSSATTFPVLVGPDLTLNGSPDGFVTKLAYQNEPPVLDLIGDQDVYEGTLLAFTVTAGDPDSLNPPTLSVVGPLPDGATFDETTGAFSWLPRHEQVGTYTVTFRATDDWIPPGVDEETITITVKPLFAISGKVKTALGHPLRLVNMKLYASNGVTLIKTVKTGSKGGYTFTRLAPATYYVKPVKAGWRFIPIRRKVTVLNANVIGRNFVAYPR